jgi:hypothetical protein
MFAIFCIPEASYVKVLQKYVLHDNYQIEDTSTIARRYFSKQGRGFTMIPWRTTIYEVLPNPTYSLDRYNNWVWVKETATFNSYSKLAEFCRTWFPDGKFIAADAKELQNGNPFEGVANVGLDYPIECFEIHEIIDNKIVSTGRVCVCIPTKASK